MFLAFLPLAALWLELKLIDWLFVVPEQVDRDAVLKEQARTAAAAWQAKPKGEPPPEAAR